MATDLTAPVKRSRRRLARAAGQARPHVRRFALVYVLLVLAVAGAAVAAALVRDRPAPRHAVAAEQPWSDWRPRPSTTSPAVQIALHTMRQYLLPDGSELTHVVTSEPRWQGAPLVAAAVIGELGGETQFTPMNDGDTIMYSLCGPSRDCSLPTSAATAGGVLIALERESLELALYSFRYLSAAQNVVVVMPPGTASGPTVLFWRRVDLAETLASPLAKTLPAFPHRLIHLSRPDVDTVTRLATPHLDGVDAQKTADGSVLFVLKRIPVPQ